MLRSAPWTRAPWLTLRHSPGSFLACALAGAVLSAAAASGPLFLASTATAALHNEAAQACPEASRPAITDDSGAASYPSAAESAAQLRTSDVAVRAALRSSGGTDPYRVSTATVAVGARGATPNDVFLLSRRGSADHVTIVAGRRGGVLVPATYAAATRTGVGSVLRIGAAEQRVAGVYRDLAPSAFVPLFRLPRYWCTWTDSIVPSPFNRPPPMLLTDEATIVAAGGDIVSSWYDPTSTQGRTVAEATTAVAATQAAVRRLDPRAFRFAADLPGELTKTSRITSGVRGPVLPVVFASVLVAALLVAASGLFWGLRREREIRLLSSRGVGRVALGVKAALELLPALALGCVAGWAAALGVIRAAGPSSLFEPGAPAHALFAAAAASAAGVVLVGVAGARTVHPDRRTTHRPWARLVPWELALLGASIACYLVIRRDGAVRIVHDTVQVNPLVTAYPLIALSGAVLLIGRIATVGLPALRRIRPHSAAGYLAVRRISRSPTVAVGVLIGVALPVAVFVYSVALSGSTQRDVAAKYRANVGAPQAFGLLTHGFAPRPGALGTVVGLIADGARTDAGTDVAVEGVDPATFARYAFGGATLRPVLRSVQGNGVPVVIVNAPSGTRVRSLRVGDTTVDVTVAGARSTFPGLRDPYRPLVVMEARHLPAANALVDRSDELWTTTANVTPALDRLRQQGVEANYAISPTTFLDSSGLRPVTWVFGYLRAIALLTGAVGVAGLGYAFAARTRRRAHAYHLARRMGMSSATHRRSIVVELGALIGSSWLAGAALAAGAVASVYRRTDAYPAFPPAPPFPPITAPVAGTALAAVLATLLGSWLLQRLVERSDPSSVLRA